MANHIKFCSCNACRAGQHSKASKIKTRSVIRSNRRNVKELLSKDRETPKAIGAGYTD
jgi:hypothetical protein